MNVPIRLVYKLYVYTLYMMKIGTYKLILFKIAMKIAKNVLIPHVTEQKFPASKLKVCNLHQQIFLWKVNGIQGPVSVKAIQTIKISKLFVENRKTFPPLKHTWYTYLTKGLENLSVNEIIAKTKQNNNQQVKQRY